MSDHTQNFEDIPEPFKKYNDTPIETTQKPSERKNALSSKELILILLLFIFLD